MAFLRRQRTYYKDGVEVPSSSITDFGRTAYYKNIVTTKYWKEITTGSKELEYACYKSSDAYPYIKSPIGHDDTVYYYNLTVATSSSQLTAQNKNKQYWSNMAEDKAIIQVNLMDCWIPAEAVRYSAGDLYIDTTVTETVEGTPEDYTYTTEEIVPVEVTADDDYDYTEFVPSTEFDYHVDSNKLYQLAAVKRSYYKYSTEPNASIVGSFARIDKGVASGFTSANYLSLPETFTIGASDSFEIVVSFVHKTQSSVGYILGASTDATLGIIVNSNNTLKVNAGNGSSWYGDIFGPTVLTSGVKYWVKLVRDTSGWYLYLSTDGKEYNLEKSNTWSGAPRSTNIYIGNVWGNTPFLGQSIDLNESYININGSRWWSGDEYTKVGSWIDDGVVSGFSSANYLSLPELFRPVSNPWERVICFKTSDKVATTQALNYINFANDSVAGVHFHIGSGGQISAQISSNGSSWDIAESFVGTTVLSANTTYYAMIRFTGSEYQLLLSTTGEFNGEETLENSITSSTPIYQSNTIYDRLGFRSSSLPQVFTGSMDLTKCYGKINNEDWWHGTKAVESNSTDYDYYTDKLLSYSPIVRGKRSYYKQTLNKRDTGTYTFTLDKDYTAKMLFVGNGCGGGSAQSNSWWYTSSGGSGACFEGLVKLNKGTYTLTIGALGYGYNINSSTNLGGGANSSDSYLVDQNGNELIRVGCGARGTTMDGGAGGVLTLGTIEVLETIKSSNGNRGAVQSAYGGIGQQHALSAYDNSITGYGAGISSYRGSGNTYGIKGIFDLVLETDITDYDWYEDIGTKIY